MSRQYGQMESDRYPETGTSVVALELEQQQQEDPHVHITKNPRTLLSRCSLTRTCIGITALCIVICVGIILALIFTVGIKNGNNSNAVIANPDDPINGGGMAGNGTSSSGPFNNFSSSTGGGGNPNPTPIPTEFIPAAPLSYDRCTQAFPQSTINPWVSTATCDQCTTAGCGWCTIPVKQSDGSTRYFTSCREKNAAGTADIGGVCIENTIPTTFKAFPAGKSTVFANAPSSSTTGLTCRAAELAEHPSTPSYPPSTDKCHTVRNARSCSACVDYTNNTFTITVNATCGWLTLPITIDGVTRWYTSCRNATFAETATARNTPVNVPAGKTKIWALNPIGAALPNTIGSCREPALADAPYTPAPYLAPAADICSQQTTCVECGDIPGCGWCSTPKIDVNGSVTVITSCRAGSLSGSKDGACTLRDPRVPATWWGYHIYQTWLTASTSPSGTCPSNITQNPTTPSSDYLDNTPAAATIQNYIFRSTLGCPKITDCTACLQNFRCGWCGYRSTGRCVPSYTSYGPTSGTRVTVDYSPLCAAPDISLEWTGCSTVPTLRPNTTTAPPTTPNPTTRAPTTKAPTTVAPTTLAPTTLAPTTTPPTPTPTPNPTSTPRPGPTGPPFIPAAPLANDRCTQAFPQSTIYPWVSTATCDQCTNAGCGWCTIPVLQSDGSTRYFTSCREKNAAGTADIGGFCDESTIPEAFKAFPSGKSKVFANAPSSSTTGLTCRAAELAEHPSTPAYPPSTDNCHTLINSRSCSACVDYTNNTFTITTTSKCGWLTLPITIDGVTRWYTSCRNATATQTIAAKNTPVNLPAGKSKTWAQNPIGAGLPNTLGSCRESALADAPYTPAPYLAPAADACASKSTCGECGATPGCGWCSIPSIAANGSVTVLTSCRAGTTTGSLDGACTVRDPRVPATWWGYNIYRTWVQSINGTCPPPITQNGTTPATAYLDNTPAVATTQNFVFRSTLGCPAITDCTACLRNYRCGWCGYLSTGRCVPSYTSYGGSTSSTRVTVDYSPICAAPEISLEWTGCSSVPTN